MSNLNLEWTTALKRGLSQNSSASWRMTHLAHSGAALVVSAVTILKGLITSQSQTHEQVKVRRTTQPTTAGRRGRSETSREQPSQPRPAELLWIGTINKGLFLYATEILWFSHYIALFCQWISNTLQFKHSTIEERCNVMQPLRMLCRFTVIPQHQWGIGSQIPRYILSREYSSPLYKTECCCCCCCIA